VTAPVNKVQTGGFGDPNGLPGKGNPNKTHEHQSPGFRRHCPAVMGTETVREAPKEYAVQWPVPDSEMALATPPPSGGGKRGVVQSGGFADATVEDNTPRRKRQRAIRRRQWFNHFWTSRARNTPRMGRNLRIEGDVVLDMVFQAGRYGSSEWGHQWSAMASTRLRCGPRNK